jgi:mannose-6-phosphate isomerase-like protein (cupin superfamily)
MIIDYNNIDWKANECFKGGEGIFYNKMYTDGVNKMMHGKLPSGSSIGYHKHEGDCEMIFIIKGEGTVLYDDTKNPVKSGQCHYCPEGHSHSLINTGVEDLIFCAVVPKQ